ncbi:MAG: HAMP domain-containing protein [Gemmatimonadetes bacterium]|nr:HAMP domain-containing protein [Gemmatimonadota bacterium]
MKCPEARRLAESAGRLAWHLLLHKRETLWAGTVPGQLATWRTLWRENPLRSALGKKLLAWLLLLSLVPLFVSNTIGYLASGRIINGLAERDLQALTAVQAHHVRDEIERLLLGLVSAARADRLLVASAAALRDSSASPVVLSGASGLAAEELQRLREQLGTFGELLLVGPSGTVVASSPRFASGVHWRDAGLVAHAATEGRTFAIGSASATAAPPLLFAAALPGPDATGPAIIVGTVAAADVGTALQIPRLLAGVIEAYIVDDVGRPVFVSRPRGPIDYQQPLPLYRALAEGARRYRGDEAGEVVASSHAVPGYALRFISEVPVRAALGELRWLRRLSVILEATFVLVLIGAAWIVSRGILRPVSQLVAAAERIGQGDLEARVAVHQRDEVGQLAERFNDMARQLHESAVRIRNLHDEQMRRAEQLATVGELAAGIAHELKTPLLGVASGAQLLSRRLEPSDAEGRRLAGEMLQRIRRMEEAMQALLSYARPSPTRLSRLDLNAIVERALRLVEPRADRSSVAITRRLAPTLPSVQMDPDQIGQVIVNLVLNGIEAMAEGGCLEVETRVADGTVELWVSDSGPGIASAERERIFRPFYTTKHTGTGLGLAIVRQIVERHGGLVFVIDRPEGGTRFVVALPLDRQPGLGGGKG